MYAKQQAWQVQQMFICDNFRYKNSARTLKNIERLKNTFINRLTYKYGLHI